MDDKTTSSVLLIQREREREREGEGEGEGGSGRNIALCSVG